MESRGPINYKILVFAPNEHEADEFLKLLMVKQEMVQPDTKFTRNSSNQPGFALVKDRDNNISYPCYHIPTLRAENKEAVEKILQEHRFVINGATSYVLVRPNEINLKDAKPVKPNKWQEETLKAIKTHFSKLGIPAVLVYGSTKLPAIKKMLHDNNHPYDAELAEMEGNFVTIEEERGILNSPAFYAPQASSTRKSIFSRVKKEKEYELQTFSSNNLEEDEIKEEREEVKVEIVEEKTKSEEESEQRLPTSSKQEKETAKPGFVSKIKSLSTIFKTNKKKDHELATFIAEGSDNKSTLTHKKNG